MDLRRSHRERPSALPGVSPNRRRPKLGGHGAMVAVEWIFDNREFARLAWLLSLIAAGCVSRRFRPSLVGVLKAFLAPKVISVFITMAAYVGVLVYLLWLARVWSVDLAGASIFWFFGPATVLL